VESPVAYSLRASNKKSAEMHRKNNIKKFPKRLDNKSMMMYNNINNKRER
jgi:hypothetical protein